MFGQFEGLKRHKHNYLGHHYVHVLTLPRFFFELIALSQSTNNLKPKMKNHAVKPKETKKSDEQFLGKTDLSLTAAWRRKECQLVGKKLSCTK